jgi:hypothetical protein
LPGANEAQPTNVKKSAAKKKLKPGVQSNFQANEIPGVVPDGYDRSLGGLLGTEADGLPMLTSITVGTRGQKCPELSHTILASRLSSLDRTCSRCWRMP